MTVTAPRVVLVGPPGAGKTTVGRALAERWAVEFVDSDDLVEAATGQSIADLFVDQGEAVFREHERAAVGAALTTHDGVLALGGGAVMTPAVAEQLNGHVVVYLQVSAGDAGSRIGLGVARPLLLGNVRGQLRRLMDERRPTYERVAVAAVDSSGRTVEQVVDEVDRVVDEIRSAEQA